MEEMLKKQTDQAKEGGGEEKKELEDGNKTEEMKRLEEDEKERQKVRENR
jgi:hypothetical protein